MLAKFLGFSKVIALLLALLPNVALAANDVTVKPVDGGYVVTCTVQAQTLHVLGDGAEVAAFYASSNDLIVCSDLVPTTQPVTSWLAWSETCTESDDVRFCSTAILPVYSQFSYLPIVAGGK